MLCNYIVHRKGNINNWFWWGFFFGFIALIVAWCQKDYSYKQHDKDTNGFSNSEDKEKRDKEILKSGGWKCYDCGCVNKKQIMKCIGCNTDKTVSDNKYKEAAIQRLEEAKKKKTLE
ncbi:MAG: hypothetical protein J6K43_12760 [Lachnospiraceae bacterium]|nr:hypothetical protein [Lachnospiraceae bacterium]